MTSPKSASSQTTARAELDQRYGQIGISAVVAALTCQSSDKKKPVAAAQR